MRKNTLFWMGLVSFSLAAAMPAYAETDHDSGEEQSVPTPADQEAQQKMDQALRDAEGKSPKKALKILGGALSTEGAQSQNDSVTATREAVETKKSELEAMRANDIALKALERADQLNDERAVPALDKAIKKIKKLHAPYGPDYIAMLEHKREKLAHKPKGEGRDGGGEGQSGPGKDSRLGEGRPGQGSSPLVSEAKPVVPPKAEGKGPEGEGQSGPGKDSRAGEGRPGDQGPHVSEGKPAGRPREAVQGDLQEALSRASSALRNADTEPPESTLEQLNNAIGRLRGLKGSSFDSIIDDQLSFLEKEAKKIEDSLKPVTDSGTQADSSASSSNTGQAAVPAPQPRPKRERTGMTDSSGQSLGENSEAWQRSGGKQVYVNGKSYTMSAYYVNDQMLELTDQKGRRFFYTRYGKLVRAE